MYSPTESVDTGQLGTMPESEFEFDWESWHNLQHVEGGQCFMVEVEVGRFEDTKGVIRISKSKDRQPNCQKTKDKQRSTKYYAEN